MPPGFAWGRAYGREAQREVLAAWVVGGTG
jgi:hypothetical protein